MKRIALFLIALFVACTSASATVYYLSDCQAGAAAGCVAGSDSNNGLTTTTPWRSTTKLQSAFNAGKPGDQFLLAKGGAWSGVNMTLFNTNGGNPLAMFTNPTVIDSYTSGWSSSVKPILTVNSGVIAFDFTNTGAPDMNGGHVLRNLSLQGAGAGDVGVRLFNGVKNVTLENITINGFNAGVACGGVVDPASNPSFITVRNSTLTNNRAVGLGMWGCFNVLVEGNTLDNNGFTRPGLDHPVYISGNSYGGNTRGVVIRNNKLTNNAVTAGLCQATVIVGHDVGSDWIIENNTIYQAPGTAYPTCWGISISPGNGGYMEGMDRLVIRGNTIANVGNNGIELAACRTCLVENNVVVWEAMIEAIGIRYHIAATTPTYVGTALTVRNNSVYFFRTNDTSRGVVVNDQGTGHTVVSNLVYFGAGSTAATCFESNLAASAFTAWGKNLCFGAPVGKSGTGDVLADPKFVSVPTLANGFSLAVTSTSPAVNAGHATLSSPRSYQTCKRASTPGIGAFEYFTSPCTVKPSAAATGLR